MHPMTSPRQPDEFDSYKGDIEDVERRVAGEFDAGARALVVAVLVFAVLLSFVLPHTGSARGFDVLIFTEAADKEGVALPSRVFSVLAIVFSVGFSILALLTRRWVLAWVALAGSAVASVIGMLAVWSRQTVGEQYPGPGFGLVIGWVAVILLTFHWARLVWTRTALQMAAEEERRRRAAQIHGRPLHDPDEDPRRPRGPRDPDQPAG
ncbi:hypothetical protein [Mycobacterium sp. SMC-4]|uniref:Rv2732c family membrane protein n=1 Tax=Mycobacterium sp. SMC-4 TaxID=2857059 RepID=UPI003D04D3DE